MLNLHINLYKILNFEHACTSLALVYRINGNVLLAFTTYENARMDNLCPQITIMQKWHLWNSWSLV